MLQELRQRFGRKKSRKIQRRRLHRIEPLEDRRVLATFMVSDTGDAGPGTLRRALQHSDALDAADTIEFASSLDGQTIQLTSGSFEIHDNVTIDASNLESLTIDANSLDPTPDVVDGLGARVFDISASYVSIDGLTIRGGDIVGDGAGIRTYGSLYLQNSTLQDNHAFGGGSGLFADLEQSNGTIEIYNSQIIDNGHLGDFEYYGERFGAQGGGISVRFGDGYDSGGELSISQSVISGNGSADAEGVPITGGGLFTSGSGYVSIDDSTIENNAARDGSGGGIAAYVNDGDFYLGNSVVKNNQVTVTDNAFGPQNLRAQFGSGGVNLSLSGGNANIVESTISGNTAVGDGGGISLSARNGSYAYMRRVAVHGNESILPEYGNNYGNRADSVGNGGGAWLHSYESYIEVSNSTFSGNVSGAQGGGIFAISDSEIRVNNSTIANNSATRGRGYSDGGGLRVIDDAFFYYYDELDFHLNNSIIGGNRVFDLVEGSEFPDDIEGYVVGSYNLIQHNSGFAIFGSNNLRGYDPLLLPLADNGGPTLTHAIAHRSPAIDAGSESYTGDYDQRGESYARAVDGTGDDYAIVDIGAFERQPSDNLEPTADAGGNLSTSTLSATMLDGSGSFDEDEGRNQLEFQWEIVSGSDTAEITNGQSEFAEFVAFEPGTYEVTLTVSDGIDTSDDTITINVVVNSTPIADPSLSDTAAGIYFPIILDGSNSSDVDADPLLYDWSVTSQPDGGTLDIDNTEARITSAFADLPGVYTVELAVSDGFHDSEPVSFEIFVSNPEHNSAPVADLSLSADHGLTYAPIAMDASLSLDFDLDPLTYSWSVMSEPDGRIALFDDPTSEITALRADTPGEYDVELVINDGHIDSQTAFLTVTVEENLVPTADVSLSESSGIVGLPIGLDGTRSSDPDEQPLAYDWSIITQPAGSGFEFEDAAAAVTSWTADTAGVYRVQLMVNDGGLDSAPRTFLTDVAENELPIAVVDGSDSTATVGYVATLDGTGSSDPEFQPLTFQWQVIEQPVGSQVVIDDANAAGTTWTADTVGDYQLQLMVNDGWQDSVATTIDVEIVANQGPTANPGLSQTDGTVELPMELDASLSSDPEEESLTYDWQVVAQPAGSSFFIADPAASETTWTADTAGAYSMQLTVNDGTQDSISVFGVLVDENHKPNGNVSLSINEGVIGNPIRINAERSTDPEGQELTFQWSIVQRPAGSTVAIDDASAAATTWVADRSGTYRVQLIVHDGVQPSAPVTFVTRISAEELPTANVSLSQNYGNVGQPMVLNGTRSSDPEMQELSFDWSIVQAPAGSTATIADPIAEATTWTTDTAGDYRIRLMVNDGANASAPVFFVVSVVAGDLPSANVSLSQNAGIVDTPVALDGTRSTDPEDRPLNFSWSVVDQPLGSNVTIAGPTAAETTLTADTAGVYRVRLIVNNGINDSYPVRFTVEISDAAPLIHNGPTMLDGIDDAADDGQESMLDRFFAMLGSAV